MEIADPFTLSTASLIAMGASAGSAAIGAGSSILGGIQAQKAGDIAAQQAGQESKAALIQAGTEESAIETNAGRLIGHSVAEAGAAGITAVSAQPVLSEDYSQAKVRSAYARFGGELASTEDIYGGEIAKWQGNQAFWKGLFGGAQNVLGGASNIGLMKAPQLANSRGWGSGNPASASSGVSALPPIGNPFALGPGF